MDQKTVIEITGGGVKLSACDEFGKIIFEQHYDNQTGEDICEDSGFVSAEMRERLIFNINMLVMEARKKGIEKFELRGSNIIGGAENGVAAGAEIEAKTRMKLL